MVIRCPACGGTAGILGSLGNVVHGACRDCGAQFECGETSDNNDCDDEDAQQ